MGVENKVEVVVGTIVDGKTVAEIGNIFYKTEEKIDWRKDVPAKFTDGTCGVVIFFPEDGRMSLRTLRSPEGRRLLETSTEVPTIWHVDGGLHVVVTAPKTKKGFSKTVRIEYSWMDVDSMGQPSEGICYFAKADRW
ncbi:MAG: hypothetical protein HYT93_01370 [Parcubacteria group bacterium]|nr:hypothetical protein [Parcubacteria group bacterium]